MGRVFVSVARYQMPRACDRARGWGLCAEQEAAPPHTELTAAQGSHMTKDAIEIPSGKC